MTRNLAGVKWNARSAALGIVVLLGSAASFAAAAAQAAPPTVVGQRVGQATDPLTLFTRLTPVLTNPRCFNCHGGTDPVNGDNHGGGPVGPDAVCQDCHTASSEDPDARRQLSAGSHQAAAVCRPGWADHRTRRAA